MKAAKMTLIAALAVGSLLTLSPALRADDATNAPPTTPPAGGPPPGGMRGPGMKGPNYDRLAEHLNLTDEQKPKVKTILENERGQMRNLWQDQSLSREDRMAKMRTIHEDTLAKLKVVLTADQFQKFQDMRPMMGGPRHGPPGGPSPGSPPPDNGGTNAPPPQK